RSCSAEEAQRRVAMAASHLAASGARWIYKKVDSLLRGNVVAEISAMMRARSVKLALLVPANPSLGRMIRDGHYFVHGLPIDQTEFALDPEYPRKTADVMELLSRHHGVPLHLRIPGDSLPDEGIVIGQAQSNEDLVKWAGYRDRNIVLAGAAAFFRILLAAE